MKGVMLLPLKDNPVRAFGMPAGIAFITFALGLVLVRLSVVSRSDVKGT